MIRILCFLVLVCGSLAVDRGNFKTCDQSGFCKRQRSTSQGQEAFRLLPDSIRVSGAELHFTLVNKHNVQFTGQLTGLQHNTARLRVLEAEPLRDRYEPPVGDVLVDEPRTQSISEESRDANSVTLTFADNKIIVYYLPLRIDIITDNEPVVSINARNLLHFEHTRKKPSAPDHEAPPPEEGDNEEEHGEEEAHQEEAEQQVEDDPTMWEETFKTHKDTKPHGPQSIGLDFSLPGFQHVYGIPEHADTLALKSTKDSDPYRLYNLDVFEYDLHNPMALYGAVPYMLAHNEKRTVGLFWLNAAETWVDINNNIADKSMFGKLVGFVSGGDEIPQIDTHWFSESGVIDVFFLLGPSPSDVFSQYATLTGTTPLPPLFGIAYHQSRWNYNDEQDVANVDAGFDQHNIPMDVIWLDIEHTDGKRYFTWDGNKFSDSVGMIDNVASKARKMVTIIDPHIKRDDNYHIHNQAKAQDLYVKNKDGAEYDGWCWPGSSSWLDFTMPHVRDFWASKFAVDDYKGSTLDLFTWNDMNEPSVFNGPEITMHKDALHSEGEIEHRDVHNIYGMYVHQSTVEGHLARDPNQRPFVLSRAFFAGSQRFGAVWTGDNMGEWSHLQISLPMTLSLNIAGITFSGADVGGFFKNPEPELITRWYQTGAYLPFYRAHAHLDTKRREPWLLADEHLKAIRAAITERYRLLPYWYTLFYESSLSGAPIIRPLWVEFPAIRDTFTIENQFLVGSSILVHPITDAHSTGVSVYFPGENEVYYDSDTYTPYRGQQTAYIAADLNKTPAFYRGGHIVPRKERIRRSSYLTKDDPFTLVVALDSQGAAAGTLYMDDYKSFDYQKGAYVYKTYTFANNKLVASNKDTSNAFATPAWLERVVVLGLRTQPTSVSITAQDGSHRELTFKYKNNVLTIRKPDVNIAQDFTITIQ